VPATLLFTVMTLFVVACYTVPAAPPVPERQTQEAVISWEISPAQGYADKFGYVSLDFTPPERLREILSAGTGQADSPGGVQPGNKTTFPAGGRLTVHLGRQGLDHANTVWYSFTVTEGSTTLLSVAGEEGIPNVKGPDNNWWNDVDLDLLKPVFREIRVTVEDRKIDASYAFTLRKLVRLGESS
jgi:hypothetical protein